MDVLQGSVEDPTKRRGNNRPVVSLQLCTSHLLVLRSSPKELEGICTGAANMEDNVKYMSQRSEAAAKYNTLHGRLIGAVDENL